MTDVFDVRVPVGGPGGTPPGPVINTTTGTVRIAIDGDTMQIEMDNPLIWTEPVVRFLGANAPELDGPDPAAAQAAVDFLVTTALGKTVVMNGFGLDKFGRILAKIRRGGIQDLGQRMIEDNLASIAPLAVSKPTYDTQFVNEPFVRVSGTMSSVIDGDTVKILLNNPLTYTNPTVRLSGIDCAELQGPFRGFAAQALNFVVDSAVDLPCTVKSFGVGKFGRVIADVIVDGLGSLSDALVAEDLASIFPNPPAVNPLAGDGSKVLIEFT